MNMASTSSANFYSDLPVLPDFDGCVDLQNFAPLPDDWYVATCDVRNSTMAVQSGKYKHVNTVGAAAVAAMLNAAGVLDIPFVFEGDGSSFCVPPQLLEVAKAALITTQEMAYNSFGLDLRIAIVPVTKIREAGADIRVARVRVSENYIQAIFSGGGMAFADRYMKHPATSTLCEVKLESVAVRGSLEGLECRWQDIPSQHGETVSLMVRALFVEPERAAGLYRKVIAKVHEIYGTDEVSHPVTLPELTLTLSARQLGNEAGVRAADQGFFGKWLWIMRTRWLVILGWVLMKFGLKTGQTDWRRYRETLVKNTDVRKFNDMYRQILAGNATQREKLDAWLSEGFDRRELVYGLHVTDRAHMTCLIFDYSGRHLHFIDGADGGLFLAAKQLKERSAQLLQ